MYLDDKGKLIKGMSLYRPSRGRRAGHRRRHVGGAEALRQAEVEAGARARDPATRTTASGRADQLQERRDAAAKNFAGKTNFDAYFGGLKAGATFKQPELAQTLSAHLRRRRESFYEGQTADLIAQSDVRPRPRHEARPEAVQGRVASAAHRDWNGYRVITAPPPSSGGIGLSSC